MKLPTFQTLALLLLIAVQLLLITGCTNDALPEPEIQACDGLLPTYDLEIRPIIEVSCAYAGCHLGDAPGIYVNYEGLLPNLESGLFRERTIDLRADENLGMPPDYSPDDRPRDLDANELLLIECWLDNGFPEN